MASSSVMSTPTKSISQLGKNGTLSGRESPMAPVQLCSATPLLEDWLFKQSSMVDTVVTKRWGVLYLDYFALFRKPKDSKPSKVIPLTRCTLPREVETSLLKVRKQSRNTVWALARGEVEEQQLHHFTITPSKGSPLTICFTDLAKAQQWLSLVTEASTNSRVEGTNSKRRWEKKGVEGGTHSRKTSLVDDIMVNFGSEEGTSPNSAPPSRKHMDVMLREEGECSDHEYLHGLDIPRGNSSACLADDPNCHLTSFTKRWRSVQHVNGVAVYVECGAEHDQQDIEGETKMMSVPVACTPEACFRAIMRHGFDNYSILEAVDAHTTVLYHRRPAGIVTSSRDCVLLRTWRRDVDGSYIILLQDTEHPAAPSACAGLLGGTVRAKVHAAGFIIAPCAPEYSNQAGRSTECLVTAVAKIDLGGWLSPRCWVGRWLASSSLDTYTTSSWVQGLVSKVITLRDLVEQDRFLRKPFDDAMIRPQRPAAIKAHSSAASLPSISDSAHLTPSAYNIGRTQSFAPARMKSVSVHGRVNGAASTPSPGQVGSVEDDQIAWMGGTLAPHFWAQISAQGFKVRGAKYLVDRKKIAAAEPIFGLATVDIVKMRKPCFHIARHLPSIRYSTAPFTFLVNIMVPSTPFLSLVVAWSASDPLDAAGRMPAESGSLNQSSSGLQSSGGDEDEFDSDQEGGSNIPASPFDLGVARFLAATDDVRNGKFKLIPRIAEGSWVIKQSVGTTPVILGRKLTTQYHRGPNYMEVDIDIGSSTVAASVVNLVYGATKSLVIDMAVLFEGQAEDELPEQLLGTVRLDHMDLGTAPWLDVERGVVSTSEPV